MRSIYELMDEIDDNQSLTEDDATETASATTVVDKLHDAGYEQFVTILNSDGKSKAFLDYLAAHYKMGDDSIGTVKKANPSETTMSCKDLQPTQQNISVEKSLGMIKKGGWSEQIINNPTTAFTTPTVTYAGKYIIDGHHRWSKVFALNGPDSELKVLNFPAISGVTWEDMLKAVQLAIISTTPGQDLIQKVPNDNMLSPEGAKLAKAFYEANACDEVVAAMKAKDRGDSKEQQAVFVENNVAETSKVVKPVAGAPKRDFMPQMDDDGRAKKQLVDKGVVDMTESYDDCVDSLNELFGLGKKSQTTFGIGITQESKKYFSQNKVINAVYEAITSNLSMKDRESFKFVRENTSKIFSSPVYAYFKFKTDNKTYQKIIDAVYDIGGGNSKTSSKDLEKLSKIVIDERKLSGSNLPEIKDVWFLDTIVETEFEQ